MSADFLILILCSAGAAYAAHAAISLKSNVVATAGAVLLFTLVAMHTVLLAMLTGDGRILPGSQFHPSLKAMWGDTLAGTPWPDPHWMLLALLGHALIVFPKPERATLLRPLPATMLFVVLYFVIHARTDWPPTRYDRAPGPGTFAYLTIAPRGDGADCRILIALGTEDDAFIDVVHAHEAGGWPPVDPQPPTLFWTKDGHAVVLSILRQPLLAIEVESGKVVGGLPSTPAEWPRKNPDALSTNARRTLSEWRHDVDYFIHEHGGLAVHSD